MTQNPWTTSAGPTSDGWGPAGSDGNDGGLADLFGDDNFTQDATEGGDSLGDLFAEEPQAAVEAPSTEGSLEDLFGAPEAPETPAAGGLGDLFALDVPEVQTNLAAVPVPQEAAPTDLLGGIFGEPQEPEATSESDEGAKVKPEGASEGVERPRRPAPVLGQLARPTRRISIPGRDTEAGGASAPAPSTPSFFGGGFGAKAFSTAKSLEEASIPKEIETPEVAAPGAEPSAAPIVEAALAVLETSSAPTLGQDAPQEEAVSVSSVAAPEPVAPEPVAVEPVVAPEPVAPEPVAVEPVVAPEPVAVPEAEAPALHVQDSAPAQFSAPTPTPIEARVTEVSPTATPRPGSLAVPMQAEPPSVHTQAAEGFQARQASQAGQTSITEDTARRLAAQAELERQARRYENVGRLWSYVDRILAVIGTNARINNQINQFELTRDHRLDNEQKQAMINMITPAMSGQGISISNPQDINFVMEMVYDELLGISVLGELWRDDEVTEIMVDRWDKIVVERSGMLIPTRLKFRDADHANSVARSLAARVSDRAVSKSNPLVTAELPGARVTFAYGPVVRGGLSITIRKFRPLLSFEALLSLGSLSPEMAHFLQMCVRARATILVSGGTGTGKTTIINLLSSFIPDTERVITIEDAFELSLSNSNWVPLQTKEKASADDETTVSLADLLWSTLRMRPDRVVVGEIRESSAAEVMIQAANTGHDGTMTTIHANSGERALNNRLAVLLRQGQNTSDEIARQTVASAFHLVVQITRKKGRRFISEISVVDETCFNNGIVVPEKVFSASIDKDGTITYRRVGGLRPETELYDKLVDAGYDVSDWES